MFCNILKNMYRKKDFKQIRVVGSFGKVVLVGREKKLFGENLGCLGRSKCDYLNSIMISSYRDNWNVNKAHNLLCHIITLITCFYFRFTIYSEKVSVIGNNTLT